VRRKSRISGASRSIRIEQPWPSGGHVPGSHGGTVSANALPRNSEFDDRDTDSFGKSE
jgi:hypothetical protein